MGCYGARAQPDRGRSRRHADDEDGLPCETVHWIVDDERASYWLYTACGLVQIPRLALQGWASDPTRNIEATVFDASDGVRSRALLTGFTPRVSQSSDGRLWFVNVEGVSVVDPMHLPINTIPPAVRIEQITADQETFDASAPLDLPRSTRDIRIDYTALSFVAPEKNRFRIKLEGFSSSIAASRRSRPSEAPMPGNCWFV